MNFAACSTFYQLSSGKFKRWRGSPTQRANNSGQGFGAVLLLFTDCVRLQGEHFAPRMRLFIRLAPSNPADENIDDERITKRIQSALKLCDNSDKLNLQIDTFMSIDRGYSPRHGLIDRLGNLTPAGISLCP